MADNAFDRTILNTLEEMSETDINQAESQLDRTLRDTLLQIFAGRNTDASEELAPVGGFFGNGFKLVPDPAGPNMNLYVRKGLGFLYVPSDVPNPIDTIPGLSDLSAYKPLLLTADELIVVPAAPAGPNTRIDILEVKYDRRRENPNSRQILNPATGQAPAGSVNKTLAWLQNTRSAVGAGAASAGIYYKTGTPGNPGVAPAADAGYTKIAEVLIGSGVATLDGDVIQDQRKLLGVGGWLTASVKWSYPSTGAAAAPTIQSVAAPPGVRVFVTGATPPTSLVWIIAPSMSKAVPTFAIMDTASPITDPGTMWGVIGVTDVGEGNLGIHALVGGDQTLLQGALAVPAGQKVAVGQTAYVMQISGRSQKGGTTGIADLRDPMLYSFTLHWRP